MGKAEVKSLQSSSQNPNEFMNTNCSQQFTKTTGKEENKPFFLLVLMSTFYNISMQDKRTAAEFEGETTPHIKRFCAPSTRSKGNSLELQTKTQISAQLVEYDLQ